MLGTLLPGERVPALPWNSVVYRDALPIAAVEAGQIRFLVQLDEPDERRLRARFGGETRAPAELGMLAVS